MTRPSRFTVKLINRWCIIVVTGIAFVFCAMSQPVSFRLAPIFTDNMVLQQQRDVPVWGKGKPGMKIVLQTTWEQQKSAIVDAGGRWSLKLPTPKAGGPYMLYFFYGDSMTVLRNVLVGEVWVCSGQSNMEMPLDGWSPHDSIANSAAAISQANFSSIRLFTIRRAYEISPSDACEGTWQECSPGTVHTFSAAAFFFGRMLFETLKVPVGLINTSFGGTPIEAWMSREALASFKEYTDTLKKIDNSKEGALALNQWIIHHPIIDLRMRDPRHKWEGLKFGDDDCAKHDFDDRSWNEMKLPTLWEQASLGEFDGVVWFRKQIAIPSDWIGKDLMLQLGPVDDIDETYVNGQPVGSHVGEGFYSVNRLYRISGSSVRDSLLQIAVRVIDYGGGGGIDGDEKNFYVCRDSTGSRISLTGNWRYLPVAEYRANVLYLYGEEGNEFSKRPRLPIQLSQNTPTTLYNGMVHPFIPFVIRGAIWYQGEANTGQPYLYRRLFPAMITDWRRLFHCGDFPFYFVQLAPYDYGEKTRSELLREAQMMTLSVKNTGMAVTLDIGNPKNIHPADKQDVGQRLAFWALTKTYGKPVPYSGPLYRSMKIEKDKIVLKFQYAEKGLVLKNLDAGNRFQIAGSDKRFRDAVVTVDGNTLIVSHPDIPKPLAVRYAFTNMSEATLFNMQGLPASSFRTDSWER